MAFKRLIDRFQSTGSVQPNKPQGRKADSHKRNDLAEKVKRMVKPYQEAKQSVSVFKIAEALNSSKTTVWRIMRKSLGWKPYKPNVTVPLTNAHMAGRRHFSKWLLEQPEDFPDRVIWTDEKLFFLHSAPNKQNERYWAPENPNVTIESKEQGGKKVMCWAAVVDGRVLIH